MQASFKLDHLHYLAKDFTDKAQNPLQRMGLRHPQYSIKSRSMFLLHTVTKCLTAFFQ